MMKILSAYSIPDELVKAISLLYENTQAKILSPDGDTKFFNTFAGVLQGDALAPYLFAIVIDYTMRQAVGDRELDLRDSKMWVHAQTTFRHFVKHQCNRWILVIFPYNLSPTTCYPNSYNLTFMRFPIAHPLGIS